MTEKTENFIKKIISELTDINHINPKDIPEIELYMDQVTTFMDSKLNSTKRYDDDKILTKTMINNYAKNNLLPPPVKKKYSQEHMIMLIFIYYFKNILSINDIQSVLAPISDRFFNNKDEINLDDIYKELYELEKSKLGKNIGDIEEKLENAKDTFRNDSENDQDFLQLFAFISSLSFDIYVKKHLVEQLIDQFSAQYITDDKKKNKKH